MIKLEMPVKFEYTAQLSACMVQLYLAHLTKLFKTIKKIEFI